MTFSNTQPVMVYVCFQYVCTIIVRIYIFGSFSKIQLAMVYVCFQYIVAIVAIIYISDSFFVAFRTFLIRQNTQPGMIYVCFQYVFTIIMRIYISSSFSKIQLGMVYVCFQYVFTIVAIIYISDSLFVAFWTFLIRQVGFCDTRTTTGHGLRLFSIHCMFLIRFGSILNLCTLFVFLIRIYDWPWFAYLLSTYSRLKPEYIYYNDLYFNSNMQAVMVYVCFQYVFEISARIYFVGLVLVAFWESQLD